MRFIDVFAGLGGFHQGLSNAGGFECVFASEIDPRLRKLYARNFGIQPHGDITTVNENEIPSHELICAGFPCQPFSLAGSKKGAECPSAGRLVDHVIRIAKYHLPEFVILENVPNVLTISNGSFWRYIKSSFENMGYNVSYRILSPINFGIPQNRKRIFIICSKQLWPEDQWPEQQEDCNVLLRDFLDSTLEHKMLEPAKIAQLQHWQELINHIGSRDLVSSNIVAPEFGATYPFDFSILSLSEIKKYRGAYGQVLSSCESWKEVMALMPSYVQKHKKPSRWIAQYCISSRDLYKKHHTFLDAWSHKLSKKNNSWQILEWRCMGESLDFSKHLVQFRASGIRVMRNKIAPSLTSMTPTQIPIVPSESRYISKHEAAKLQHLSQLKKLPDEIPRAFKALGNAVNARIVELIALKLSTNV